MLQGCRAATAAIFIRCRGSEQVTKKKSTSNASKKGKIRPRANPSSGAGRFPSFAFQGTIPALRASFPRGEGVPSLAPPFRTRALTTSRSRKMRSALVGASRTKLRAREPNEATGPGGVGSSGRPTSSKKSGYCRAWIHCPKLERGLCPRTVTNGHCHRAPQEWTIPWPGLSKPCGRSAALPGVERGEGQRPTRQGRPVPGQRASSSARLHDSGEALVIRRDSTRGGGLAHGPSRTHHLLHSRAYLNWHGWCWVRLRSAPGRNLRQLIEAPLARRSRPKAPRCSRPRLLPRFRKRNDSHRPVEWPR